MTPHILLVLMMLVGDKPTQGKIEMPDLEHCFSAANKYLEKVAEIEGLKMAGAACQIVMTPQQGST
jgi:hypothetical protein